MGQYRRRIVIKNRAFNLEKEALFASGIREKRQIAEYGEKLSSLCQEFTRETIPASHPLLKAKTLFSWLWEKKPTRYNPHGNFKLNHVIDAQMSKETQAVGNCLGLTLLYNCLLRRMSIRAAAIYLEYAFERGPHVLTTLRAGDPPIDVENILPEGFDYKGHLNNPSRTGWGDKELVADIYLSVGNDFFEKKEWIEALKEYDLAIQLNPQYEKARLNKAILLDKIGRGERAKNGS
jgi:tetratricopeptide (TPR) repeat protein